MKKILYSTLSNYKNINLFTNQNDNKLIFELNMTQDELDNSSNFVIYVKFKNKNLFDKYKQQNKLQVCINNIKLNKFIINEDNDSIMFDIDNLQLNNTIKIESDEEVNIDLFEEIPIIYIQKKNNYVIYKTTESYHNYGFCYRNRYLIFLIILIIFVFILFNIQ